MLVTLAYSAEGANILAMFLMPSYSHQMPLLCLSKALAARGHNLTVITANPSETPLINHTEIDISFAYEIVRKGSLGANMQSKQAITGALLQTAVVGMVKVAELELKSPQMQHFLSWAKDVTFDVVLYETILMGPYLALVHTLGSPPVIGVSTVDGFLWSENSMGSPTHPAYVPVIGPYTDHMTFFERLYNLYDYLSFTRIMPLAISIQDQAVKDIFGEGFPSVYEMEYNKTLLLLSGDGILNPPKAMTPNVIQVGPMHILPPKPLTGDLKTWVEGANDGVIYFSLGSNMQGTSLPEGKRNAFLAAFKRFPNYRVIWKWESDTFYPGQADNIVFKKWVPQQDLLAHNKVKVFISQCGLQSSQEAIHHGVNLICVPLFGDQNRNSKRVIDLEIGTELDFNHITADTIYNALREIIYSEKYRENMKQVSAISRDRIMSPVDLGVWWVEYVLKHKGAKHLRPATLDLHWTQYLFIDIALFFIAIISFIVFLAIKLTKMVLKCLRYQTTMKVKDQ